MTKICCICQEETSAFMPVSQTKVGTPPILIKNILLECWSLDKLPNGALKDDTKVSCIYCQTILVELYEATLCVAIKRNELERRFKDPKHPEPQKKSMGAKKIPDILIQSHSDEDFDDDWSDESWAEEEPQTEAKLSNEPQPNLEENESLLVVMDKLGVQDNLKNRSDEDFDDDWSDGSWAEKERQTNAKLPNKPQKNFEENEPLSTVRDKLQVQRAKRYCRECEVECPSEEVFKLHVKKFHLIDVSSRTSKVNFFCTLCKVELPTEDEYRVHMVHVHQRGSEFHCDTCQRSFNTHTQLVAHIATHEPHTCTICGKSLSHRRGLLRHMETHNAEKKHQCAECGNKYPTRASLKKHMMIHTDTRNYECSTCGNRFRSGSHLKRHQNTHRSLPKDHICSVCAKQFSALSTLKAHMKIHDNVL